MKAFQKYLIAVLILSSIVNCSREVGSKSTKTDPPPSFDIKKQEWSQALAAQNCSMEKKEATDTDPLHYTIECESKKTLVELEARNEKLKSILAQVKLYQTDPAQAANAGEVLALVEGIEWAQTEDQNYIDKTYASVEAFKTNVIDLAKYNCQITDSIVKCPAPENYDDYEKMDILLSSFKANMDAEVFRRGDSKFDWDQFTENIDKTMETLVDNAIKIIDREKATIKLIKEKLKKETGYSFLENQNNLTTHQTAVGYKKLDALFSDPNQKPNLAGKIFDTIKFDSAPTPYEFDTDTGIIKIDPLQSLEQIAITLRNVPGVNSDLGKARDELKRRISIFQFHSLSDFGTEIICLNDSLRVCQKVQDLLLQLKSEISLIKNKYKYIYIGRGETDQPFSVRRGDDTTIEVSATVTLEQLKLGFASLR